MLKENDIVYTIAIGKVISGHHLTAIIACNCMHDCASIDITYN